MRSMLAFLAVYAGVALLLPGSPAIRAAALVLAEVLALVDSFAFIAMNTQRRPAQRYRAEDLGDARAHTGIGKLGLHGDLSTGVTPRPGG
jgi:hypothetical protein